MTEQQKRAAEDQQVKINSLYQKYLNGEKEIGLFGTGGTGKTQSVIMLLEKIIADRPELIIGGAAPSHSAKNVLDNRFKGSSLLVECRTIASMLRLRKTYTSDGEVLFIPSVKKIKDGDTEIEIPPPISEYDIIVIDECSQVSVETKQMIDEYRKKDSVVIYLGDWHQTPAISKERDINDDSPTFKVPNEKLTIPFRYEGDLQLFADAIASEIDKFNSTGECSFSFLRKFYYDKNPTYKFYRDKETFVNDYIEEVKNSSNIKNTTLISYRNETTKNISDYVRNEIIGPLNNQYLVNDVVVCKRTMNGDNNIENSQLYKINKVYDYEASILIVDGKYEAIYTGYTSFIDGFYNKKKVIKKTIPIYLLELEDSDGNIYTDIPVLKDNLNRNYIEVSNWLKSSAMSSESAQEWARYYSFIEYFGLFQYAYAVNTYVVQGDTYNNAFINLSDILTVKPISNKEKLQSIYTAVTRARYNVSLLI